MLYSGLHIGGHCWASAVVFAGGSDRVTRLAFLELTAPLLVAVGGQKHDPSAGSGSWEPLLYGLHQMQMRNKNVVASWEA